MEKRSGVDAVHNFWEQVWRSPQNFDAIDDLVVEDFVIISGGRRIEGREAFKKWAEDFSAAIGNFDSEIVDSFENRDGSRVAATFTITGTNNGAFGTEPTALNFRDFCSWMSDSRLCVAGLSRCRL
jgi:SnoaL-like polyketide cyclase